MCPEECSHCIRTEFEEIVLLKTGVNTDRAPTKVREDQEKDPVLKKMRQWKEKNRQLTWQGVLKFSPLVKSYMM